MSTSKISFDVTLLGRVFDRCIVAARRRAARQTQVVAVARALGPPDPGAPPCIRQRLLPVTAGDRHRRPPACPSPDPPPPSPPPRGSPLCAVGVGGFPPPAARSPAPS